MDEPDVFFADFGIPMTVSKADGSSSVQTKGIFEKGTPRGDSDSNEIAVRRYQATISRSVVAIYEEGDRMVIEGREFEILDPRYDAAVVTYTLHPMDGEA